jgi:hypothetical protein
MLFIWEPHAPQDHTLTIHVCTYRNHLLGEGVFDLDSARVADVFV